MSISVNPQWYKNIWTLDMKAETWVEQTDYEIGFVTTVLQLEGSERILDLACGFGRHALALAQKGHSVVGVDITQAYVEEGRRLAKENQLDVEFICADIRDVSFEKAFDVVLNLGDGAIGYLENDEENLKVFDLISSVLKPGGKHLMSVPSAAYAKKHFPRRFWDMGSHSILLAEFDWDENNLRNLYTGYTFKYGEVLKKPSPIGPMSSTRLYTFEELNEILQARHIEVQQIYGGYDTNIPPSDNQFTQVIYSHKRLST